MQNDNYYSYIFKLKSVVIDVYINKEIIKIPETINFIISFYIIKVNYNCKTELTF
jgi:hypothetical protein